MSEESVELEFFDTEITKPFRSYGQLITWLAEERANWSWLASGSPYDVNNVAASVENNFNSIQNHLAVHQSQGQSLQEAISAVKSSFSKDGWLRFSQSKVGQDILRIREKGGDDAAMEAMFRL